MIGFFLLLSLLALAAYQSSTSIATERILEANVLLGGMIVGAVLMLGGGVLAIVDGLMLGQAVAEHAKGVTTTAGGVSESVLQRAFSDARLNKPDTDGGHS